MKMLLLTAVCLAGADPEVPVDLPRDGTWARYHVVVKRPDSGTEGTVKQTIRSVGRVIDAGIACRWIEIETQEPDGSSFLCRLLIDEKSLTKDRVAELNVIRGWLRIGSEVRRIDATEARKFTRVLMFLPGSLKQAKALKQGKVVRFQRGDLKMESGFQGRRQLRYPRTRSVWKTQYTMWKHKDVPIGFAFARFESRVDRDDAFLASIVTEYSLEDFGDGARPGLDRD